MKKTRVFPPVPVLIALLALGAAVRFPLLNHMDLKGDEVELYEFVDMGITPGAYARRGG